MSTVAALLYGFELLWYIVWKQIRNKLKVAENIRGLKKGEQNMSECHFSIFATLSTYKLSIFAKALKAFCVSFACLHYRGQNFHLCLCQEFVSRPSLRSAGPWCIQSSLYQCKFISIKESFIYQIGKWAVKRAWHSLCAELFSLDT